MNKLIKCELQRLVMSKKNKILVVISIVILSVVGIVALVGMFEPNAVAAYLLSVATCVGSLYVSDKLDFLLVSSKTIFDVMAGINHSFWVINSLIVMISYCLSAIAFEKRDYLC